ncbi:hypothetical protein CBF34_06060 [Vagococcus penaei]|uniref:Uncharacterized protein n=1 Tax=Vagococcus penaei TaxID=633807 RepID=A0A1Q2D6V2_9ENTE|nr:hypothetical protein [Vagococcus penaei]AQP54104.1 hypothetical protein BW732_07640 [Vagococcus penaei]RSU02101.1 hypothetical protein CBF34_06060 [Vagococcus penaei]
MRAIYIEYQKSKSPGDDFFYWFLIRKLRLVHQLILIGLLLTWLIVAPSLVFWMAFFKGAVVLAIFTFICERFIL